jgi:hypothetical protein
MTGTLIFYRFSMDPRFNLLEDNGGLGEECYLINICSMLGCFSSTHIPGDIFPASNAAPKASCQGHSLATLEMEAMLLYLLNSTIRGRKKWSGQLKLLTSLCYFHGEPCVVWLSLWCNVSLTVRVQFWLFSGETAERFERT